MALRGPSQKYKKSIIPDSIKLWNSLSKTVRESTSSKAFKSELSKKSVPNKFLQGLQRKPNIVHSQLRLLCSNLNSHLHRLHVIESPNCTCCNVVEDCDHYFTKCPLYHIQRISLYNEVQKYCTVTVDVLSYGSKYLSDCDNLAICKSVEEFLTLLERFN